MPASLSRHLASLPLSGLAITAQVGPDGSLLPVAGAFDKLLAAAREKSFPRLHTVVVAHAQPLETFNLTPLTQHPNLLRDPYADFHVVRACTVEEAITLLTVDAQTRWGNIDCSLPTRDQSFVGRVRLLDEVRRFVATHDSGYLVIVGGMGQGKTAFMAELIRAALARDEDPIYHFIDYHPSASAQPHNIAACLYSRLQRKYLFPEPREWERLTIEDKLEQLLKHLSETEFKNRPEPEVLYLDATDQAEASAGSPLLPGVLRSLPRGVVGVITSRPRLEWLGGARSVTVWEMADYVDDRADVRAYLEGQTANFSTPLDAAFVDQIVSGPNSPVFFTIAQRLRQLADSTYSAAPLRVRTDPDLWCVPPEELIETEALRMIGKAESLGLAQEQVWRTLGVLAVAREGLSETQLQAFQTWEDGLTPRVLKLAANFFAPRPTLRQPELPYRFDHPGYHQEVLNHLSPNERAGCHRLLAAGCILWQELDGEARRYALRHGPYHLLEARQWEALDALLGNEQFVQARCAAGLIIEIVADIAALARAGRPLARPAAALVEAVRVHGDEHYWMQIRSALAQFFGRYAAWPEALRTCLEASDDFNLVRYLADTYDMEEQLEAAARAFEKMRQLAENTHPLVYASACIRLATVYGHQHKPAEALQLLDGLVNQPGTEAKYGRSWWWAQYHCGVMLQLLGRSAEAKAVLQRIEQSLFAATFKASVLHRLGIIDLDQGDYAQAEAKFKACLVEHGESDWNYRRAFEYRRLGQVYALTNRSDEAQAAFNEALNISKRCGNQRYVQQTQADIAKFLAAPALQREQPALISLSELAQRFNIDNEHLAQAFPLLHEARAGYLEVVDAETAQPTGQAVQWEVAHREGWWHASISVIIVDEQGNVAWQQRGETDSHAKWDISVAGHLIAAENDLAAAVREIEEEIGLKVAPERLRRIGQRGEFRKVGSPTVKRDGQENPTSYVYQTNKKNYERVSLFVLTISEDEKVQMVLGKDNGALAVKWVSLAESTQSAQTQPKQFASSFKQVLGHEAVMSWTR